MRAAALVLWFLLCLPFHLLARIVARPSPVPQWFLAGAAWIVGARVTVEGAPAGPHTLLIANHVSWIDILVLAGATGCAFVSKDQLGNGLVHWLADQNHTLYVRRDHLKGAKDQARALGEMLDGSRPVALFPEGTVGPGDRLLPFRSALFAAAEFAGRSVSIRPAAIDYGAEAKDISWFGESGAENVRRVLGRSGTLAVTIRLLPPLEQCLDRKQMAAAARSALSQALGFTNPAASPIGRAR